jgi:hypothetical protein
VRDTVLPVALLAASLGLALSFADEKHARNACLAALGLAVLVTIIPFGTVPEIFAFVAICVSVLALAASVHLPLLQTPQVLFGLACNAGLWAGMVTHVSGNSEGLMALALVLLFIPGRLIVARGWGIGIKVVCSWLIAIAALEIALLFVPTPGYAPDHME